MKLLFRKGETQEIEVFQVVKGRETTFSYSEMIKELLKPEPLEVAQIEGGFADEEIQSIHSMVKEINQAARGTEGADREDPMEEAEDDFDSE